MSVFVQEWHKMQRRWKVDGRPATQREHEQIEKYVEGTATIKARCPGLAIEPPPSEEVLETFGFTEDE